MYLLERRGGCCCKTRECAEASDPAESTFFGHCVNTIASREQLKIFSLAVLNVDDC